MASAELEVIISGKDRTKGMLQGITGGLQSLGKVALGVGAAGLAAVGAAAVTATKDFVNFQQGMNEVFTLMPDISGQAMDDMTQQVKDLSTEFGVMPEEVVPALYQSISAGVPRDNVFSFLETAQKAAAGGVTELETAVDGISSVVNAYGSDVLDATQASDQMFTAVRLGKTTFGELSSSLSNVTPIASSLGVEFGDMTAAIAAMTSQGVSTSQTTTQLRQLLVELSKAGSQANSAFVETAGVGLADFIAQGNNMQDVLGVIQEAATENGVAVQDMFSSVEAGSAALALTGAGAETFAANLDEMSNAAGATDTAFERMNGGLQATFNRLKATGKVALLDFADAFSPLLEAAANLAEDVLPKIGDAIQNNVVPFVESLVNWITVTAQAIQAGGIQQLFVLFEDGSNRLGGLIALFGVGEERAYAIGAAISSVVGPIVKAIGQFVSWKDILIVLAGAIAVGIALIVGPLVIAIAKITLIVGVVVAAVKLLRSAWESNWGGIRDIVQAAIKFVQNIITTVVTAIRTFWAQNGDQILAKAQQIWTNIQTAIQTAITTVQNIIQRVTAIIQQVWGSRSDEISGKAQRVWSLIQDFISGVVNTVQSIIQSVMAAVASFWQSNHDAIQSATEAVWDAIGQYIEGVVEQISFILDAFIALFTGDWEGFGEAIGNIWRNSWETVTSILSTLWDGFKPLLENLWESISSWFSGIDWGSLGRRIVDGIVGGLSGLAGAMGDAIRGAVRGATGGALGGIPGNQLGTSFFPGGLTMVGEGGPELVALPRGSRIFSNSRSERMLREGGGNNVTLNIYTSASSERIIDDARMAVAWLGGV